MVIRAQLKPAYRQGSNPCSRTKCHRSSMASVPLLRERNKVRFLAMTNCSKCGKENDTVYSHCRECQRDYSNNHYRRNKGQYLQRNQRRAESVVAKCVEYLRSHPCVDCGESDPVVLDFDHVRGKKRFNVAYMIRTYPWSAVLKEIAKCVVRCANCHRRKTFGHLKKFAGEAQ